MERKLRVVAPLCVAEACEARIELLADDRSVTVLRPKLPLQAGEVLDCTYIDCKRLCEFYEECIQEAKDLGVLFSLHLKATMMKIPDPIMFGHCVKVYFRMFFAGPDCMWPGHPSRVDAVTKRIVDVQSHLHFCEHMSSCQLSWFAGVAISVAMCKDTICCLE